MAPAGRGRLRASHADRDQVIDVLKAAFVQGRLTKGELDARLGQTLAAQTYADLAALTADIPARSDLAHRPGPGRALDRPENKAAKRAVKSGVCAIAAIVLTIIVIATAAGEPVAALIVAVFMVMAAAAATAVVGSAIAGALMLESRHRKRR
jgi:hypothetical protein